MSYQEPVTSTSNWGSMRVGTGLTSINGIVSVSTVTTVSLNYGFFYSTSTQVNTTASTVNIVTWDVTGTNNQVSISGQNLITVVNAGTYQKVFTLSFAKTSSGSPTVADIWLRYNGGDITNSRQQISVPNQLSALFITGNYTLDMAAGSNIGMCWSCPDTAVQLEAFPAAVGPVRPAIPSAKITLTRINSL